MLLKPDNSDEYRPFLHLSAGHNDGLRLSFHMEPHICDDSEHEHSFLYSFFSYVTWVKLRVSHILGGHYAT